MTLRHLEKINKSHEHLFVPGFCFIVGNNLKKSSDKYFKITEKNNGRFTIKLFKATDDTEDGYETNVFANTIVGFYYYENKTSDDNILDSLLK